MKPLRFCRIGAHRAVEERGWNVVKNSSHVVKLFVCVDGRYSYEPIKLAILRNLHKNQTLFQLKIWFKRAWPLHGRNIVENEIGCNIRRIITNTMSLSHMNLRSRLLILVCRFWMYISSRSIHSLFFLNHDIADHIITFSCLWNRGIFPTFLRCLSFNQNKLTTYFCT